MLKVLASSYQISDLAKIYWDEKSRKVEGSDMSKGSDGSDGPLSAKVRLRFLWVRGVRQFRWIKHVERVRRVRLVSWIRWVRWVWWVRMVCWVRELFMLKFDLDQIWFDWDIAREKLKEEIGGWFLSSLKIGQSQSIYFPEWIRTFWFVRRI